MRRILFGTVLVVLALAVCQLQASTLSSTYTNGVDNQYEDQSRDRYIDIDGSGTFNVGDILVAWLKIDNKIAPNALVTSNNIYLIVSQRVASVTAIPTGGGAGFYDIAFDAPTPGSAYALDTLLGDPAIAAADPDGAGSLGPMAAVFSVTAPPFTDNITVPSVPGGDADGDGIANEIQDVFSRIIAESPTGVADVVFGLGGAASEVADDFFFARTATVILGGAGDVVAGGHAAINTLAGSITVGSFSAGLSELLNRDLNVTYNEVVASGGGIQPSGLFVGPGLHDAVVSEGSIAGANNIFDQFGPTLVGAGPETGQSILKYSFQNQAKFTVNPTLVPEPSSSLIWVLSLAGVLIVGVVNRNRRKK